MKTIYRSLALALFAGLLLGNAASQTGGGCGAPWIPSSGGQLVGSPAPNFTLPDLAGNQVELENLTNKKPTLLVFWATWCPSCVEEIPTLNDWKKRYPEMEILGVNVEEPLERVQKFSEKVGFQYPVVLDEDGEVAQQYDLVGVPATVLIAKGGRIIYYGYTLPQNIEPLIQT